MRDYLYSISSERLSALMGNAGIRMSVFPHLYADGVVIPKEGFETDAYIDVPVLMLTGTTEFSMFAYGDSYYSRRHGRSFRGGAPCRKKILP